MRTLLLAAALGVALLPGVSAAGTAPSTQTLSGTVTDTAGTPLAQVRVTVLEAQRSTTTDPEGHYTLPGLPSGAYGVSFALVSYAPQVQRVTIGNTDVTHLASAHQPALERGAAGQPIAVAR